MKKLFYILFLTYFLSFSDIVFSYSLESYVQQAVRSNLELKSILLQIEKRKLDFKKNFRYLKPGSFKNVREEEQYQRLRNQKADVLFKVKNELRKFYYQLISANKLLYIATLAVDFEKKYFEIQKKNFNEGKISRVQLGIFKERYLNKKVDYQRALMNYKNSKIYFLFLLDFDFDSNIPIDNFQIDKIPLNFNLDNFQNDLARLKERNRNIKLAKKVYEVSKGFNKFIHPKASEHSKINQRIDLKRAQIALRMVIRGKTQDLLNTYLKINKLLFDEKAKKQKRIYTNEYHENNLKRYSEGKISEYEKNQSFLMKKKVELDHLNAIMSSNLAKEYYLDLFR